MQTFAPGEPDLIGAKDALQILGLRSRTSLSVMVGRRELIPATTTALGHLFHRSDVEALRDARAAANTEAVS